MNLLDEVFDILSLLAMAILVLDLHFKKLRNFAKHLTDFRVWTCTIIVTGFLGLLYFTHFHPSDSCGFICNSSIILQAVFIGFSVSFPFRDFFSSGHKKYYEFNGEK